MYFQRRGFRINKKERKDMGNMKASAGAHFLGRFKNGQVYGHYWIGLCQSGYIHGVANEDGIATGDDMVFIYRDGETAYRY